MIRVLVADDHEIVRKGIILMLENAPGLCIAGEACSGEDVQEACRQVAPDVILMDIRMPGIGGLEATRRLASRYPDVRVIALSASEDTVLSRKILSAGAWGYITKGGDCGELIHAIHQVHRGKRYICSSIAQEMAIEAYNPSGNDNPFSTLSPQEYQVAMMVIDCHRTADIAETLSIEPKTVNSYRYRIFQKLGVNNDVGMTRMAIKYGLVD